MTNELERLVTLPPADIDRLPVEQLVQMQEAADNAAKQAATALAVLHGAFQRRYAVGINDTGTSHRTDGGYAITVTIPKRVEWDQEKLVAAVGKLRGMGENPDEYVETKLTVQERKYTAWPNALRDLFEPARTVKAGKPSFAFAAAEREAA